MKIERMRIHFLGDVFAALAFLGSVTGMAILLLRSQALAIAIYLGDRGKKRAKAEKYG